MLVPDETNTIVAKKVRGAAKRKATVQPYLIVVGPDLSNIERNYIVTDDNITYIHMYTLIIL
ncbi:unnamed protein product [Acanthoscelides obtectus]|uniref:Uncharacterized protein n=1 Tax=Acanthoscelides obtectus TaxID=200917 RepID=A0A9P0L879_ACAOB|nr:unnamed protein product [Acanthoscelides obtectus]CAK1649586.1 hypothetical protein AOBTE_LOCUS16317 [Acanthoscelides obtectus]